MRDLRQRSIHRHTLVPWRKGDKTGYDERRRITDRGKPGVHKRAMRKVGEVKLSKCLSARHSHWSVRDQNYGRTSCLCMSTKRVSTAAAASSSKDIRCCNAAAPAKRGAGATRSAEGTGLPIGVA